VLNAVVLESSGHGVRPEGGGHRGRRHQLRSEKTWSARVHNRTNPSW